MIQLPRRSDALLALTLLLATAPAMAAPVRKAPPKAAPPRAALPNNSIIPLPLAPTVPAAQRLCAGKTASGLGYTILRAGPGAKPSADATVLVNYIGYLAATGSVFDQGMQSPLPVSGVIKGFAEGLQLTGRTGIVRLCIPAAIGYGAKTAGPIPANADLVFQVELIDFRSAEEIAAMRKAQPEEPTPQQDAPPPPQ